MSYHIINSKEDWEGFYWYAKYYLGKGQPFPYPDKYPCLATRENMDGGIGGDYMQHSVAYPPDPESLKDRTPIELLKIFQEVKWITL